MSSVVPTAPVLVVQHEDECPAHLLGDWLTGAGVVLDVRRPYAGDELPADLAGHGGLVVLGGAAGAYDDEAAPWLPSVRALVGVAAHAGVPTLGVCLGHQLVAVALGGRVARNPRGRMVGVRRVGWTGAAADDSLFAAAGLPPYAVQWNADIVVDLPVGAEVMARAETGEVQAARFAPRVWGVQVHPEADHELATAWARTEPSPDADTALADLAGRESELASAWSGLGPAFAAQVAGLA